MRSSPRLVAPASTVARVAARLECPRGQRQLDFPEKTVDADHKGITPETEGRIYNRNRTSRPLPQIRLHQCGRSPYTYVDTFPAPLVPPLGHERKTAARTRQVKCRHCGEFFHAPVPRGGPTRRTCSNRCANAVQTKAREFRLSPEATLAHRVRARERAARADRIAARRKATQDRVDAILAKARAPARMTVTLQSGSLPAGMVPHDLPLEGGPPLPERKAKSISEASRSLGSSGDAVLRLVCVWAIEETEPPAQVRKHQILWGQTVSPSSV